MITAHLLTHCHLSDNQEMVKIIGIYASGDEAKLALHRISKLPGFQTRKDGFEITEYQVNEDNWTSGFIVVTAGKVKNKSGDWEVVRLEHIKDNEYKILDTYEDLNLIYDVGDVVVCDEIDVSGILELHAIDRLQ